MDPKDITNVTIYFFKKMSKFYFTVYITRVIFLFKYSLYDITIFHTIEKTTQAQ